MGIASVSLTKNAVTASGRFSPTPNGSAVIHFSAAAVMKTIASRVLRAMKTPAGTADAATDGKASDISLVFQNSKSLRNH